MKLVILGGGGFRVPLVYRALLADAGDPRVDVVVLYDPDVRRLTVIASVLEQLAGRTAPSGPGAGRPPAPRVVATTDLDRALDGAAFVFSAIRVGGVVGRTWDERVALELGVLGQETTGAGGVAYGLRTVPVARRVAERTAALAPNAWVINFTNPAGMITQAMQATLGNRVIGICDSPVGLVRRAATALGLDPAACSPGYVGLNHLGWLRSLHHSGVDRLPELVSSPVRLAGTEEGRLFGADWIGALGAIPNEYLHYYYLARDTLRSVTAAGQTRGEFLAGQQKRFYAAASGRPDRALGAWQATLAEREATYLAEFRAGEQGKDQEKEQERDPADLAGGGYERVALAIMAAIARGRPTTLILNVRNGKPNGTAVPGLPADAVVELPCRVDAAGPVKLPVTPLTGHMLGLVAQVKEVEELTIAAAVQGSPGLAVQALALHPLVDSVTVARQLLAGYRARIPQVDAVFTG